MSKAFLCLISMTVLFCSALLGNPLIDIYYTGERLPKEEALEEHRNAKRAWQTEPTDKNLCHYIDSCTLLSIMYASGRVNSWQPLIETFSQELEALTCSKQAAIPVMMAYADYLYSELSWKHDAQQNISRLPLIYRGILRHNKNHREAMVKLAIWHITAATERTANWNAFIRRQEDKLSALEKHDLFMAYLSYSLFYMRMHNIEKGYQYLDLAEALYPSNPLHALIRMNYDLGTIGW